jgi:hypothetical protein
MREAAKKRPPITDETRRKMSIAHQGNKSFSGKKLSEEHKKNIALSVSIARRKMYQIINPN